MSHTHTHIQTHNLIRPEEDARAEKWMHHLYQSKHFINDSVQLARNQINQCEYAGRQ